MKKHLFLIFFVLFVSTTVLVGQSNLILWNKLGSTTEVQNSEEGPDGVIVGSLSYESVNFNNGVENDDDVSYITFNNSCFNGNAGTIEFWFKTDFNVVNGQAQGSGPQERNWMRHFDGVSCCFLIFFDDSAHSDQFHIWFIGDEQTVQITPDNVSWSAGEIHHFAVVYDRNSGFDGSKTIAVFLDGVEFASTTSNWGNYDVGTNKPLYLLNCIEPESSPLYRGKSHTFIDNLKIWNYTKTDFSDRFIEGTNANIAPQIAIIEPDGVGDSADSSYTITWNDYDDDSASISLYYDTDNSGYDGTLIISGLSEDADGTNGSYLWDTTAVAEDSYYIYAVIDDGVNSAVSNYSTGAVTISHPTVSSNLILWNKLGFTTEVQNGEVGGPGSIKGSIDYQSAQFGNGAHSGASETFIWFTNQDFTGLERKGCFEIWFKTDYDMASMPDSHIIAIEGEPRAWNGGGAFIFLQFRNGIFCLCVRAGTENISYKNIPVNFSAGELHHTAVSWDNSGIDSSDDIIRVYFDANLVWLTNFAFDFLRGPWDATNEPDLTEGKGMLSLFVDGYDSVEKGSFSSGLYFPGVIDNLKVWNYAKTDFSDRCSEDGSVPCTPETNIPEPPGYLKSTAGSEIVNLNWELSSSPDIAYYKVYRSETSGVAAESGNYIGQTVEHTYHDNSVENEKYYYYIVTAVNDAGKESEPSNETWAHPGHKQHNLVVLQNKAQLSKGERPKMKYKIVENSEVTIKIYNVRGELVKSFGKIYLTPGDYEKLWDGDKDSGSQVNSGIYIIELDVNGEISRSKVIIKK